MPRWTRLTCCLAAASLWVGCSSPLERAGSTLPGSCTAEPPRLVPQKTDILFVIDNSDSMAEEQAGIASELPAFIDQLKQGAGIEQDFRVGVITTTVYQNALVSGTLYYQEYPDQAGKLQPVPDAAPDGGVALGTGTERMLEASDPALLDKFGRLIRQGTGGSGQETPFEAVRLATGPLAQIPLADGGNGGFFRDGARLLVVVVSDEDDCSAEAPPQAYVGTDHSVDYCTTQADKLRPVSAYYDDFTQLKDGQNELREVLWAAIAPVSRTDKTAAGTVVNGQVENVDCPTSSGPGYRHRQMAALFDAQLENLTSICQPTYHDSLVAIASLAAQNQTVAVMNVPDPRLLVVDITRQDGSVQSCSVSNDGISYEPAHDAVPARVHFLGSCQRRADDQKVEVRVICAA